jgi:hypothetical protein
MSGSNGGAWANDTVATAVSASAVATANFVTGIFMARLRCAFAPPERLAHKGQPSPNGNCATGRKLGSLGQSLIVLKSFSPAGPGEMTGPDAERFWALV